MRILTLVGTALFFIGCNNSAEKKEDKKDTANLAKQMEEKPAAPDTVFTAFGTEPFWSVYFINNADKIVFHPADGPDTELPYDSSHPFTIPHESASFLSRSASDTISVTISKKQCSDGMSKDMHSYQVEVMLNGVLYKGCGRAGK